MLLLPKKNMKKILLIFIFALLGCKDIITYESDLAFMSSAVANSGEALISLNGSICKDMAGQVGFCFGRVSQEQDLQIRATALPYEYRLYLTCSSVLNVDRYFDVQKNESLNFLIPKESYKDVKVFNCVLDKFKAGSSLSSKFAEFRMRVVNKDYISRSPIETIKHKSKNYLVFDRNSKYGYVKTNLRTLTIDEMPALELRNKEIAHNAWSCSESTRCNYYGY